MQSAWMTVVENIFVGMPYPTCLRTGFATLCDEGETLKFAVCFSKMEIRYCYAMHSHCGESSEMWALGAAEVVWSSAVKSCTIGMVEVYMYPSWENVSYGQPKLCVFVD